MFNSKNRKYKCNEITNILHYLHIFYKKNYLHDKAKSYIYNKSKCITSYIYPDKLSLILCQTLPQKFYMYKKFNYII